MGKISRRLLWLYAAVLMLLLLLPVFVVIPIAFNEAASFNFPPTEYSTRWFERFFTNPKWIAGSLSTIGVALSVSALTTVVGTAAALGLSRIKNQRLAQLMQGVMIAPILIPAMVVAIGIYSVFLRAQLVGTFLGFVLAHSIIAIPFVVISVTTALKSYDLALDRAAQSLGAGPWTTFFRVTLPQISTGVLSGAIFAFVASFDEVVISLFIKSPALETLPVLMYTGMTREIDPTIAAASTLIIGLLVLALFVGLLLRLRKASK